MKSYNKKLVISAVLAVVFLGLFFAEPLIYNHAIKKIVDVFDKEKFIIYSGDTKVDKMYGGIFDYAKLDPQCEEDCWMNVFVDSEQCVLNSCYFISEEDLTSIWLDQNCRSYWCDVNNNCLYAEVDGDFPSNMGKWECAKGYSVERIK